MPNLPAQLNCDADYKVVYFQTHSLDFRPVIPHLNSNQAQRHIDGKTINLSYKTAISNTSTEPLLRQHIQSTNDWSDATMHNVCWTSHGQALNRTKSRHVQLVKLCHNIVPTAKMTHRYNERNSSSCPLCKAEVEDLNHLLQCNHPNQITWRSQLYTALHSACKAFSTRKVLINVLIQGLDAWFTNTL
jgi:hypothetical protein